MLLQIKRQKPKRLRRPMARNDKMLFIFSVLLVSLAGCNSGTSTSNTNYVAYIVNKNSGLIDLCNISNGTINLASCFVASSHVFNNPIDLVGNSNFVYLSESSGVFQCNRLADNTLANCNPYSDLGESFPVGLAIDTNNLYVTNYFSNVITYSLNDPNQSSTINLNGPTDIFLYNNSAFIVTQSYLNESYESGPIYSCSNSAGVLSNCSIAYTFSQAAGIPLSITVNANIAYITNASAKSVLACNIVNNQLQNCVDNTANNLLNYPYGITILNNTAYIPNRAESSIVTCSVNGLNLTNCIKTISPVFNGPTWVTILPS